MEGWKGLEGETAGEGFAGEVFGPTAGAGMGDQDGGGQRQDVAVARLGIGGGGAALGGGEGAQDARAAGGLGVADRCTERLRGAPAFDGAGEDDADGRLPTQQDAQHVALHGRVKPTDHRRAGGTAGIGPVLRLQDHVTGAGLGAEEGDALIVDQKAILNN